MAKQTPQNISPAKLKEIWTTVSAADWLTLLTEYKPSNNWAQTGGMIKGLCTQHVDSSPSMILNLERGFVKCYGASCNYYAWDPIRFFADMTGVGYATALRKLKTRFRLKLPGAFVQNAQQIDDNNKVKLALMDVMNQEFCDLLMNPDDPEFAYAKTAGYESVDLKVWLDQRKFPYDVAHRWPVGVLPPRDRVFKLLSGRREYKKLANAGVEYLDKYIGIKGGQQGHVGSIAFFYFLSPTTPGRIRIRHPSMAADKKNFWAIEDPYDDTVGFFGLNVFSHLLGDMKDFPLYVVEGEMDTLSIISHELSNGIDDIVVVGTGGNMDAGLDQLAEFGFQSIYALPDSDVQGIGWAEKLISENDHVSRVFRWTDADRNKQVKDVDEAIRAYGFNVVYTRLTDENEFSRNHEWVAERLEDDIAGIDPEDATGRAAKAAEWGNSLRSEAERSAYVKEVSRLYDIEPHVLLKGMIPKDDSVDSFIQRLINKLKEEYFFIKEGSNNMSSTAVTAWSNRKRVMRQFSRNSRSAVIATFESDLGDLSTFVRKKLGMPTFLTHLMNYKGMMVELGFTRRMQLLHQCFAEALANISSNIPTHNTLVELGQGLHWLEDYDGENNAAMLIANGSRFFCGRVNGDNEIKYKEMDSPKAGNYYFRLSTRPWSKNLNSVADIEAGAKYDPGEIFRRLVELFKAGWKFHNHEMEPQFLAADVMYTPIFSVFSHLTMLDITGESQSGKTTLLQIIGGNEFPDLRLCEATVLLDDYSEAAVRQTMRSCRLRLFLDEFEDREEQLSRGNKRAAAVRSLLELIRNMTSGTVSVVRGTTSGDPIEYLLHFPVSLTGISTMREARDLNRFVHIRTDQVKGFKNPAAHLRRLYTKEEMANLRRGVTLCLLPRIPAIMKAHKEVSEEFLDNAKLPPEMMDRLKNNFLPLAAIMKHVGADYVTFLTEYSQLKTEEMDEQGGSDQESRQIWQHVLHTPVDFSRRVANQDIGDLVGITTLNNILVDSSTRPYLRDANLGVYFWEKNCWLIVHWQQAVTGILHKSTRFSGVRFHQQLKRIADEDTRVISKEKLKHSHFLAKVRRMVRIKLDYSDFTVIDLSQDLVLEQPKLEDWEEEVDARKKLMTDIPDSDALVDRTVHRGDFEI